MEKEARLILEAEDKGLEKVLSKINKGTESLAENVKDSVEGFTDFKKETGAAQKVLDAFGRSTSSSTKGISSINRSITDAGKSWGSFTDRAEQANSVFEATDSLWAKMGAGAVGYSRHLGVLNNVIGPLAGFHQDLDHAGTGAGKALVVAKTAGQAIIPTFKAASKITEGFASNLESMGGVAASLAPALAKVSGSFKGVAKGFQVASIASDLQQFSQTIKEFTEETLPELKEQFEQVMGMVEALGLKQKLFGTRMATTVTIARTLNATLQEGTATGNLFAKTFSEGARGVTVQMSQMLLKFVQLQQKAQYILAIAEGFRNAYFEIREFNRGLQTFQNLGVDSSSAEIVKSLGFMGERLIFNTEATERFMAASTQAFARLQDQLAYVTTLPDGMSRGIENLQTDLQNLVNGELGNFITSLDAANAQYDAISAGQSSTDFLEAAAKFTVTGSSMVEAVNAGTSTMNIFRVASRDADKVFGQFATTIADGVINGQQLAGTIGQLAIVGRDAGASVEDLQAMMAALTKAGFSANDAAQGIMSLLSSVAGQGAESAKAASELGVRFDFMKVKSDGLVGSLQELTDATGGSISKLKTIIPDSLAFRTAMALSGGAADDYTATLDRLKNTGADALDEVFGNRRQSLMQRTNAIANGFNEVLTDLGQRILPLLEPGIRVLESMLEFWQDLPAPMKNFVAIAALANITVGKTVGVFNSLGGMLISLAKAWVMGKVAMLAFTAAGRAQLAIMFTMIKQGNILGAVNLFLNKQAAADAVAAHQAAAANTFLGKVKAKLVAIKTALFGANNAETASETANTAATQANTAATAANAATATIDATATTVNTAATTANTVATTANTGAGWLSVAATKALAVAKAGLAGATTVASVAMKGFSFVLGLTSTAIKAIWVALGPIGLAIIGVTAAIAGIVLILREFIPILGGVAKRNKELADGMNEVAMGGAAMGESLDKTGEKLDELAEKQRHYEGFTSKWILGLVEAIGDGITATATGPTKMIAGLMRMFGADEQSEAMLKPVNEFESAWKSAITNVRDGYQAFIDRDVIEAQERLRIANDAMLGNALESRRRIMSGGAASNEVNEQIKEFNNQRERAAMGSQEFIKLIEDEREAVKNQVADIDERIKATEALLEQEKNPERRKNLELQIDLFKREATALEESNKAWELYRKNLQDYGEAIDDNDAAAAAENTINRVQEAQDSLLETLKDQSPEVQAEAKAVFQNITDGMNLTSTTQRRNILQLANATEAFFDSAATAASNNSQENLEKYRSDFDLQMDKIRASFESGAIDADTAKKMAEQVRDYEIQVTENGKKGTALRFDQIEQANQDIINFEQQASDRRLAVQQEFIEETRHLERTKQLNAAEANVLVLDQEVKMQEERVKTAQWAAKEILENQGVDSPAYQDARRKQEAAERELEAKRYESTLAQTEMRADAIIKGKNREIEQVRHLEATYQKTSGEAKLDTLKLEQQINDTRLIQAQETLKEIEKLSGKESKAYERQQREVAKIQREIDKQKFDLEQEEANYAMEKRIRSKETEIAIIQAEERKLQKTRGEVQQEVMAAEAEIAKERMTRAQEVLDYIASTSGVESDIYKEKLQELQRMQADFEAKQFEKEQARLDYETDKRIKVKQAEIAIIQGQEKMLQKTRFEAQQAVLTKDIEIAKERMKRARQTLEFIAKTAGIESDIYKEKLLELQQLETEVNSKEFEVQNQKILHQMEVQLRRINNEARILTEGYQSQLDTLRVQEQLMASVQKIEESRRSLVETIRNAYNEQLDRVSGLTNDERVRAEFAEQRAKREIEAINERIEFEQRSLEFQQESQKMALERQKIEHQISLIENERAIAQARIDYAKARRSAKLEAEERKAYELSIQQLERQGQVLKMQGGLIEQQALDQAEILEIQKQELGIRQQSSIEAAKMQQVEARYARITAELEKQKSLTEKKQDMFNQESQLLDKRLSILGSTARNEVESKRIAQGTAAIKVKMLQRQQAMERKILEINLQQQATAIEIERAKMSVLKAEAEARIADSQSKLQTAIAEGATPQQLQALYKGLEASLESSASIDIAQKALDQNAAFMEQSADMQREMMRDNQRLDRQGSLLELAGTLGGRREARLKRQIRAEINEDLGMGGRGTRQYNRLARGVLRSRGRGGNRLNLPGEREVAGFENIDTEGIRANYQARAAEFAAAIPKQQFESIENQLQQRADTLNKMVEQISNQPAPINQANNFTVNIQAGEGGISRRSANNMKDQVLGILGEVVQGAGQIRRQS